MSEGDAAYVCTDGSTSSCPFECVSLTSCEECGCATTQTGGGPWGNAMDVIICLLPLAFLLVVTLKPDPLPTTTSLPLSALFMVIVRLMYLGSDPLLVSGSVIKGLHEGLTPLSIMGGAILLFESMEATLCLPYMMREMKALTNGHKVTELMMIFSFAYMVEGASGFGTPVALGAPMLVSLGHPKFECVVTLLTMNTFATVWGAAGTPLWFGFGGLGLTEDEFVEISYQAAVALVAAAFLLMPVVLRYLLPFKLIRENGIFVFLAISGTMFPALGLAFVSYEFPALIGGMIGCGVTGLLTKFKVGLKPMDMTEDETGVHPMDIGTVSEISVVASFTQETMSVRSLRNKAPIEEAADDFLSQDIKGKAASPPMNGSSTKESSIAKNSTSRSVTFNYAGSVRKTDTQDESDEEQGKDEVPQAQPEDGPISESHLTIDELLGPRKSFRDGYLQELLLRTFPIWATVLILVLTRVPQIGLKGILTAVEPSFTLNLNSWGIFKMSASLVVQLYDIMTYPNLDWKYELLYVPFLVPFTLVSFLTMGIYRKQLQHPVSSIIGTVCSRLKSPAIALMGALVLVQLMITGGEASPAHLIGNILSSALKGGWIAFAAIIGVLGSFFSGSTTISNLTFGHIQLIAAENIGVSKTAMLALQAAGASAGNGVCLNNIISACTVVGLNIGEGKIIAQTFKVVLAFAVVATLVELGFMFA